MHSRAHPICQALNLSDNQRCAEIATANNDVFCRFHAKQCFGMYMGYKRRNAKLDELTEDSPPYLKSSGKPLANMTFEDISNEATLRAVHAHFFKEYVLLGKVIDARRLHHKHFYPLQMDYGHQSFLDTLSNRRHIVLQALEKIERRTAEVLYKKEKWFKWVCRVQEDDEAKREKEQKRVKLEAAMFKRHWKKMQSRIKAQREREEKRQQDAFLEEAYQERVKALSLEEYDDMWDPIEDIVEDERGQYIDLIKHFLWMDLLSEEGSIASSSQSNGGSDNPEKSATNGTKSKKSKKKARANALKLVSRQQGSSGQNQIQIQGQGRVMGIVQAGNEQAPDAAAPNKSNIETEPEMRKRLKEGVEKNFDDVEGPILVGSMQMPHGSYQKTAPLADEEIDALTKDIKEIKLLLFCRLLLSHTSLLPAALRASGIEDFLADPDITQSDLRDLCLRVEDPSLQDIRDACADLGRGDELDEEEDEESVEAEETIEDMIIHNERYGHLQAHQWLFRNLDAHLNGRAHLNEATNIRKESKQQKMKVTICGKSIWNYSNQSSMSRNGWLQFSVLAKDCDLRAAISLCRSWDEFEQLNFLTAWQYFPASNWVSWGVDAATMQLHELGFFPYFKDLSAYQKTHNHQIGGRSQMRRQHSIAEARNIVVGHMKRNDSFTRRFIQYCTMRAGEILILVRDGKTGKIVTAPEKDHMWTYREKNGLGRASKNNWDKILEVGHDYFMAVDILRKWHLGFDDHYEVWIWDFVWGRQPMDLYGSIVRELKRARRIKNLMDLYQPREQFLRSLTRNQESSRVRSIIPGEDVKSIWDNINGPNRKAYAMDPTGACVVESAEEDAMYLCFNEADAAEDEVLFPDELTSSNHNITFGEITNPMVKTERHSATPVQFLARGINQRAIEGRESEGSSDLTASVSRTKTIWSLPDIWEDAVEIINDDRIRSAKRQLLRSIGLLTGKPGRISCVSWNDSDLERKIKQSDPLEVMEKDRGAAILESFHLADLEPGAPEKYEEVRQIIEGIQTKPQHNHPTEWVWFIAEVLSWLEVRTDYGIYNHESLSPWPHAFIIQDIVKAFTCMAMFFPEIELCEPATEFFKSDEGRKYKDTLILKPLERSKTIPKHRTRTSYKYRPKSFFKEWQAKFDEFMKKGMSFEDDYPREWSIAIRPIIAKLYRAGIIAPANVQNDPQLIPGIATANTEPHRPKELDMFIDFSDRFNVMGNPKPPPTFVHPREWPDLLARAREFSLQNGGGSPKFAVLRLWSAPHFWPLMIRRNNRRIASFLDPLGRGWEFKFVPKDGYYSEWSTYNSLHQRLELFAPKFGDRVTHRGDVVLVMGEDARDLLKYVVAVTFVIQTKPWYREIDLWKSFINVDLEFLEGLDTYWLD